MSFSPRYTITNVLLQNIKKINTLIGELNSRRFPQVILMELEKEARAVSAFASTRIEGNPLPLTEVKKLLKQAPAQIRDSEREVLNYNQALENLDQQIQQKNLNISLKLMLNIHRQVTSRLLSRFDVGKIRRQPVVVNDPRTGKIVYLPPDHQQVPVLIEDLVKFVVQNRESIDPLILAGIFHKQLVIIHPFIDGNGRTARLITKVLLAAMGLDTFHLFSFENYYNHNITKYFQIVGESGNYYELVEKIDFTPWLEYFTAGIIDELLRVQEKLSQFVGTPETQLQPHHTQILEYIYRHGFISDSDYARLTNRAKATRALDFQKLLEQGLIERKAKGKATYYILKEKTL